jgi:hypothetical protein
MVGYGGSALYSSRMVGGRLTHPTSFDSVVVATVLMAAFTTPWRARRAFKSLPLSMTERSGQSLAGVHLPHPKEQVREASR